ncbi:MAG: hypothetical protein ACT4OY_04040 [Alphaproteobacteria bacterium]
MKEKTKGWTEERRRAQAERIRQVQPWLKSTGPRSVAGKEHSIRNALKHGRELKEMQDLKEILRVQRHFTTLLRQTMGLK